MPINEIDSIIEKGSILEQKGEYFHASFYYKQALTLARNHGMPEKITSLKAKLVTINRMVKTELQERMVKVDIPDGDIEKVIQEIVKTGPLFNILKIIGQHPCLYPVLESVKECTERTMPVSFHIANLSMISHEGHIIKGGSDPKNLWFSEMYKIEQGIKINLYINNIFERLIKDWNLNEESLLEYFESQMIFSENALKMIKIALLNYFTGDYVSSFHILVPQFESAFLYLSERLGIDIVALNAGKDISTQTKTLSSTYLDSSQFTKVWGDNFCAQINFILFDPMGYKLRHKVAHGEILIEECNLYNTNLLIYLFLRLASKVKVAK